MYPQGVREKALTEDKNGASQCELSGKHGISRYAIQCWIGARPEKNMPPKQRGRKSAKTLQEYKYENIEMWQPVRQCLGGKFLF